MRSIFLLLLCFTIATCFRDAEEQVLRSRWRTSYLQCSTIEMRLYRLASYIGFEIPQSEVELISVLWESGVTPIQFLRSLPRDFSNVLEQKQSAFVELLAKEFAIKQRFLKRVERDFAETDGDVETLFKFTKELSFEGTVLVLRRAFAKTRPNLFHLVEKDYGTTSINNTSDIQPAGKNCPPYLPLENPENSQ